MLWRKGRVIDLNSLGGKINNAAFALNDLSEIVGASDLPGDTFQHAFLWRKGVITDLGTLKGDVVSAALGINNKNLRAFLWQNGVMTDLNTLIPADSPLFLLHGFGINSEGQIVGFALQTSTGEVHAFLATPCDRNHADGECCRDTGSIISTQAGETTERPRVVLSEGARKLLQQGLSFGRFGARPLGTR